MELIHLILGELETNCYILDIGHEEAIAFDIGGNAKKVLQTLEDYHLQLKAILLTHGHYDHIGGVEAVRKATGAEVYIHENDAVMLESGRANLAYQLTSEAYLPVTEYHVLQDGAVLELGDKQIQVMHTPGHTSGGVCYLIEDMLFSGDTLFKGSIGRTDLGGNPKEMKESLRKIAALDRDYKVYPGHFQASTLDREKKTNPYLRKNS